MKKTLVFLTVLAVFFFKAQAQVTIGSGLPPDKGALLDLKDHEDGSSSKGLLLPRVALITLSDPSPLTEHVDGMYVYNTSRNADVEPGNYVNDGQKWIRIKDAISEPWLNSATNAGAMNVGEDIYHLGTVGMGTTQNHPSAQVQISSVTKGLLVPRLSKIERDAITDPANGLIIFNTTSNCINYYSAPISRWLSMCGTYDPAVIGLISCDPPVGPSDDLTAGKVLTLSDTYTLAVSVSEIGTYEIIVRTTNGYAYSKSGLFTSTGNYNIVLDGQGAPVAAGSDNVTVTINGELVTPPCPLPSVLVNPASVTFSINCLTTAAQGTYTAAKGLNSSNYIEATLTVTNPGTAVIETTSVNGMTFRSGSINLENGTRTVRLYGSGTPVNAGTFDVDIIYNGASICTNVPIIVGSTKGTFEDPVLRCQEILVEVPSAPDGYYWLRNASNVKFKTYCDMDNANSDAWTLVQSLSERQILVVERTQNESIQTQQARNVVTTQAGKFNEYAFAVDGATVSSIGNSTASTSGRKFRFTIKEEGHTTASGATVEEIESSTVSPDNDVWAQDNYWNVTIFDGNPATGNYYTTNNITEGKLFGRPWGKPSASSMNYNFDGAAFAANPPGFYSYSNFFTGFYGALGYAGANNPANNITYTYHDRTDGNNGKTFTFNKWYINDLFGLYMNSEWQLNHHIGTCSNSTDDFGGASYCNTGWANWRPHRFNQRPDSNYEGRILQVWVK